MSEGGGSVGFVPHASVVGSTVAQLIAEAGQRGWFESVGDTTCSADDSAH
jgi:hypothetical protein